MAVLLALVAAVVLSPPFGRAEARAVAVEPRLVVAVTVEVGGAPTAVLVRGRGLGGELPPVALSRLGPGRWGGFVEVGGVEDLRIAFEAISPDGRSVLSTPSSLTELGVDAGIFRRSSPVPSTPAPRGTSPEAWLLLGVVAGAAALGALAVWARRGGGESSAPSSQDEGGADADDADAGEERRPVQEP